MWQIEKNFEFLIMQIVTRSKNMAQRIKYNHTHKHISQNKFSIWNHISNSYMVFVAIVLMCTMQQTASSKSVYASTKSNSAIDFLRKGKYLQSADNSEMRVMDTAGNTFRPMVPSNINSEYMARNVFTKEGYYRVFEPIESDLRIAKRKVQHVNYDFKYRDGVRRRATESPPNFNNSTKSDIKFNNENVQKNFKKDVKELEGLLATYMNEFFGNKNNPKLLVKSLSNNDSIRRFTHNTNNAIRDLERSMPTSVESGRLLFTAGLKKVMWPVYMGLNILKSLLLAMFLPTLIGSVGQMLGKGIISGSAPLFIRPLDTPQELDFRDNTYSFEDDKKVVAGEGSNIDAVNNYAYPTPEASQINNQYVPYNPTSINQLSLSRYGMTDGSKMQGTYLSALQTIGSASFKNSGSLSGSSFGGGSSAPLRNKPIAAANVNTFQTFQKVPASSLLLSNYDPFYSPLLSRLDSVFGQLKLNSENEVCREKAICLMYANPAKYAPYSNLVSAQLSRELNELRKPTSDNADILRFFKYMRAAKDGQDGVDCEKSFETCTEFKDYENPAMVSTFHDINKLVQARKLS